jgi:UDP-glucose 4-epimerase
LIVYGDGTQQRDYLYVGDLMRGIETAIDREIAGTYQLGSGKPTSLRQLIAVLSAVVGHELEVLFKPARRGEVHATWCNIAKATHDFDFSAPTTLDTGMRATWDWFAENRNIWENNSALTASD